MIAVWEDEFLNIIGVIKNPSLSFCIDTVMALLFLSDETMWKCPATTVNRNALMGACTLTPEDLKGFHWSILLKFAKNSGRC